MTDQLKKIIDALVPIINELSDLTSETYTREVEEWEDDDVNIEEAVITQKTIEVEYRITTFEIVRALFERIHDDADKASMTQMDIDNAEIEKMTVSEIAAALDEAFPDLKDADIKAYRIYEDETDGKS